MFVYFEYQFRLLIPQKGLRATLVMTKSGEIKEDYTDSKLILSLEIVLRSPETLI